MSDSARPRGLQPARLLCPWDSPGKNTGVGCHALLQGIFLTQGSNPHLLYLLGWQVCSLPLALPGKLKNGFREQKVRTPRMISEILSLQHGLLMDQKKACKIETDLLEALSSLCACTDGSVIQTCKQNRDESVPAFKAHLEPLFLRCSGSTQ